MPYRLAHPTPKWKRFLYLWGGVIALFAIFSYYPINPNLDDLAGPVGDLERAKELLATGQFEQGLAYLIPEARAGNPEAQYILGSLFNTTLFTSKRSFTGYRTRFSIDHCEETYWMDKAARQGHGEAQYMLSVAYLNGIGVIRNPEAAYLWGMAAHRNGAVSDPGIIRSFVDEDLSDEAVRVLDAEFVSWSERPQPPARIIRLPSVAGFSAAIRLLAGVRPCGAEYSWIVAISRDLLP